MSLSPSRILCLSLALFLTIFLSQAAAQDDFSQWLASVRIEARQRGISTATLNEAFKDLQPIERVVVLDHKQPEFTQTFWHYLDHRVTQSRIERGRRLLALHHDLLAKVEKEYGVQAPFLVSFWGLETNFGDNLGGFPVVGALATLAHDQRRSNFFKNELFAALTILDRKHVTLPDMQGSWAGAMGQPQFMPSTFLRYAVDEDGDGRADIWHSLPDVFASAANFLSKSGWQAAKGWGVEVALPAKFNLDLTGLKTQKTVQQWRQLGVRQLDAAHPAADDTQASVVLPAGIRGPAFLVFANYRVILNWNRSDLYAVAVGYLADRLQGRAPLLSARPELEEPLSFSQVQEMQALLQEKGFQPGPTDGVIGSGTRNAIKAYQRSTDQPPDGYPTMELLQQLQNSKKE